MFYFDFNLKNFIPKSDQTKLIRYGGTDYLIASTIRHMAKLTSVIIHFSNLILYYLNIKCLFVTNPNRQ